MTRILHILDHSLPLQSGYSFRTRAILKAQEQMGWRPEAVTGVRQYQDGEQPGAMREVEDGLVFHRTPVRIDSPTPIFEWREVSTLAQRIVELHRAEPFDLLHAHSPALGGLAGLRAARQTGLPLLYEIRACWEDAAVGNGSGQQNNTRYRIVRALETHVARRADAIATICEGLRNDLIKRKISPDKVMVSPNGVDMGLFGDPPPRDEALARELGIGDADVIGFIGSFYDYEGLDDLVAAMPMLARRMTEAGRPVPHLLLVGGGPMADAVAAQAKASGLSDHIHFTGRVPHDAVSRYYSLIDILAYPRKPMRLTELVTPLKPLEAMAQGRLVLASDVGGHRELIEDGVTVTLFGAGDPAALAHAAADLLLRRDLWDDRRQTARTYVEKERNWAVNVARYRPVYHSLLDKPHKSRAA